MGPLARHLGAKWVIANRLEFRDGIATGRLLDPVIRPRGVFARITGAGPDGTRAPEQLVRDLGLDVSGLPGTDALESAVSPASRHLPVLERPIVHFHGGSQAGPLSVRATLAGKRIMLIGVTGFIGKVWLVNLLMDLPEIGRIYLLIRRQKSNPAEGGLKSWSKSRRSSIRCTSVMAQVWRDSCGSAWKWWKAMCRSRILGCRQTCLQA